MKAASLSKRHVVWTFLLALAVSVCACDKGADKKKMADLCDKATKQLEQESQEVDDDTFRLMIKNALSACSQACDLKHEASCSDLENHLGKMCETKTDFCDQLCKTVDSPSLKKYSCAAAGKKS